LNNLAQDRRDCADGARQVARDTDKFQEFSHAKKRATDAADDLRTRLGSLLALLPPAS
jgi:hypothetical protein